MMTSFSTVRQQVRDLVEQLPDATLTEAVVLLEKLRSQPSIESETVESELLQVINWTLPEEDESRLAYLRQCNESGLISADEQKELLAYVERLEGHDARRAEALISLAKLRQVDLDTVLEEFLFDYGS